jgi:hypothetical protein
MRGFRLQAEERMVRQNRSMGMRDVAERQGRIELELMEERAAALRRISETLESLIEQLQALRARIGDVHWSSRAPEVAEYREVRRRAVRYRWYLEVQREALGLHPDHRLDEFYRIPEPI